MKENIVKIIPCVVGLAAVFYGMIKENNVIFLIGILFIIIGYILIRKILKKTALKKNDIKLPDD